MSCLLASAATEIAFPFDGTLVVPGREATIPLAVAEFNDIVSNSTGRTFPVAADSQDLTKAARRIFIGHSPEAEAILGTNVFARLLNEESIVFARGSDLFLLGGGELGPLWAVYDFCEDSLGYRWYLDRRDGEKIVRTDVVRWNGVVTRRKPKFTGFRISYDTPGSGREFSWRFRLRNRDTQAVGRFCSGYRHPYDWRVSGHGFGFFLPPFAASPSLLWAKPKDAKIETDNFKKHPEWFSLMPDGSRNPDHQLCLSNRGCRDALTRAVLEWVRCNGKGYYMVGSNDARCGRYCHCAGCLALEKKYNTRGGPLWDYMLELCAEVKRLHLEGVYITTLAYDGIDQTEKAPDNIVRFPDNFDANIAYIRCPDRSLKDLPDVRAPEGEVVNYYRNTCKWVSITSHASYWFYGTRSPFLVCRRMQKELQELCETGVESVGSCDTGGGFEFGDFTPYLYRRLAFDPWCDIRKELEDVCAFKYGRAASLMLRYIDSLEATFEAYRATTQAQVFDAWNPYRNMFFLKGSDIAAWRRIFAEAEPLVADSPFHAANVRFARIGLDVATVLFEKRVRAAAPDLDFDRAEIETAGQAAASEYVERHCDAYQRARNPVPEIMRTAAGELAYYPNLRDESLPAEFAGYQMSFVTRILPYKSEPMRKGFHKLMSEPDADSPCGYAIRDVLAEGAPVQANGIPFYIWDHAGARQMLQTVIPLSRFRRGEYATFRIGVTKLVPDSSMIICELWDSPLAGRYLNRCYDAANPEKRYEIWMTAKAEGPAFWADEKGPSRISVAALYVAEIVGN